MPHDSDPAPWVDALAGSHDRLSALVVGLDAAGLRQRSYCEDWSVAQVLSHLGSGAEITRARLASASADSPPPDDDELRAIWSRWDALEPEAQAEACLDADGELVETLEHMGDRLEDLRVPMLGTQFDAAAFVALRLGEHALHTWDVDVTFEPRATLDPEAAGLLAGFVGLVAGWAGKPDRLPPQAQRPFCALVRTTHPEGTLAVRVDDRVAIEVEVDHQGATASVCLPAEAFVRLVYGRLDPAHAPPVDGHAAATLEQMRAVFPGF